MLQKTTSDTQHTIKIKNLWHLHDCVFGIICFRRKLIITFVSRYLALYKGLLPKVLRLGPGGAIMLVVYEYMHAFLVGVF